MNGLRYILVLEEPVLANSLAGDTNSARSLSFVPGGLVRGALIGAYAHGKDVDAVENEFRRLFLNGDTRFLPAYPEINKKRAFPTSQAWKARKHAGEGDPFYNFAVKTKDDTDNIDDLKSVGFTLWQLEGKEVYSLEQEWNINVHTQRDAMYGRAMGSVLDEETNEEDVRGAVFRYEALPAGLRLHGMIFTANDADAETFIGLLKDSTILLGKARTAGYGHARVEIVEKLPSNWREKEYWPWQVPAKDVSRFTLTFVSPALVRDDNGQLTLDPIPALSALFGFKLEEKNLKAEKVFRKAEIVGGFNRTWGLPLPQSWAISAGSVFVFTSGKPVTAGLFQKLEESGVGERRAEGFGCVAIDVAQPESATWKKAEKVNKENAHQTLSDTDKAMGMLMLERLLRRELDSKVLEFVSRAIKSYSGGLSGSQLSRWRVIVRSVLGTKDPAKIERLKKLHVDEVKRSSPSWKKMERARIFVEAIKKADQKEDNKTPRLTEWLESALNDDDQPWKMLKYADDTKPSCRAGSLVFTASDAMKLEYSLRVIDALFAALAHKGPKAESKKEGQNG